MWPHWRGYLLTQVPWWKLTFLHTVDSVTTEEPTESENSNFSLMRLQEIRPLAPLGRVLLVKIWCRESSSSSRNDRLCKFHWISTTVGRIVPELKASCSSQKRHLSQYEKSHRRNITAGVELFPKSSHWCEYFISTVLTCLDNSGFFFLHFLICEKLKKLFPLALNFLWDEAIALFHIYMNWHITANIVGLPVSCFCPLFYCSSIFFIDLWNLFLSYIVIFLCFLWKRCYFQHPLHSFCILSDYFV